MTKEIIIELTKRCNLACQHCPPDRHNGRTDLPLALLEKVLSGAAPAGFDRLSFTGGEPTLHPDFAAILARVCAPPAAYHFGLVTNGQNFPAIYPLLQTYRARLTMITFSLDGATPASHDWMRGGGAFRRLMQAVSICVAEDLPFTFNSVLTAHNRDEVAAIAAQAARLGARGLRFGHLFPDTWTGDPQITTAPQSSIRNLKSKIKNPLELSPSERRTLDSQIGELRNTSPIPIALAPGYYTHELFPCAALQDEELDIDCYGRVTRCCLFPAPGDGGDLNTQSFSEILARLAQENERFRRAKTAQFASGGLTDDDYFPCWYCTRAVNGG